MYRLRRTVITELVTHGPSVTELALAKRHLRARLTMENDDPETTIDHLARAIIYWQAPFSYTEAADRLARIGPGEVIAALAPAAAQKSLLIWKPHED